jgi:hypothetical protein
MERKNGTQRYQCLVTGRDKSYFVKSHSKSNNNYKQDEIIQILDFLIDNIFVMFGPHLINATIIEKLVSWYFWRPVLTAVEIEVEILERGLLEHLASPAILRCLYGQLWNFGIQYSPEISWYQLFYNSGVNQMWILKISKDFWSLYVLVLSMFVITLKQLICCLYGQLWNFGIQYSKGRS